MTTFVNEDKYPKVASQYTLLSELGHGATSRVYRAQTTLTDGTTTQVAIKIMDLSDAEDLDLVFREITLMRAMNHENLASVITCFLTGDKLWIVMDLLGGGSVRSVLKELAPDGFKTEPVIAAILHGALQGLAYMHQHNYIHRDIKAGNILISSEGVPKLADFGVAATTTTSYAGGNKRQAHTFTGTPCWMAPEVIAQEEGGYTTSADIWSLGITALELAYGAPPYAKLLPLKAMMATIDLEPPTPDSYQNPTRTKDISKDFRKFIARTLKKDPTQRPSALELLQDPFLKKAPDSKFLAENIIALLPSTHLTNSGAPLEVPPEIYGSGKGGDHKPVNPMQQNALDDDGFVFDTLPIHKKGAAIGHTQQLQQQVQQHQQPSSQSTTPQNQQQPGQISQQLLLPQLTQAQFNQLTPEQQQQYIHQYQQQQMALQSQQAQQAAQAQQMMQQQQLQQQQQQQQQMAQQQAMMAQQQQHAQGQQQANPADQLQDVAQAIREIQAKLLTLTETVRANQNPDDAPGLQHEIQVLSQQLAAQQQTLQLRLQIAAQQRQLEQIHQQQAQQQQQQQQQAQLQQQQYLAQQQLLAQQQQLLAQQQAQQQQHHHPQ